MEFSRVLFQRRSIRNFTSEGVEDEKLKKLIEAGMTAPSANNKQPWHFVIVKSDETMERIREVHPYSSMLSEASAAISVCGNTEKSESYWPQDCSAATQNILLRAEDLGLGAVWLGVYPRRERQEKIGEILGLPAHIEPLNVIAVGYPAEESERVDRYDPDCVHHESW